jgi:FimV-like protein
VFLQRALRRRDQSAGAPSEASPTRVKPVNKPVRQAGSVTANGITAVNQTEGVAESTASTSMDDLTPAAPMPAYDDMTPVTPMAALGDLTPASPLSTYEGDIPGEAPSQPKHTDFQETVHELSDRFKDMLEDKDASNLALARVYLDLGDYDQAKPLLASVHRSSTPEYAKQADDMIQELLQAQIFAASFNMIMDEELEEGGSTVSRKLETLSLNKDSLDNVSDSFMSHRVEAHEDAQYEFDVAQRLFKAGNCHQSKQHLANILGFRRPELKTQAYDLLKEIEQYETEDEDKTMKSPALPDDLGDKPVKRILNVSSRAYSREQLNQLSGQFMAMSGDASGRRLALANFHLQMGEPEMAVNLCNEIIAEDSGEYRAEAKRLLDHIARMPRSGNQ